MKSMIPYKQKYFHSCLAASFVMLLGYSGEEAEVAERKIFFAGEKKGTDYYMLQFPIELIKQHDLKINIFVDNNYFTKVLNRSLDKKMKSKLTITHQKITLKVILDLLEKKPIICHIDENTLGEYSHSSHFIVLLHATEKRITGIDPSTGKKVILSHDKLLQSIVQLKNHVKMCPLILFFE